jgi:excisionase family DNA binding protein
MRRAKTPDVERLAYSVDEVAAALGCTRNHVVNLISRGQLPSFKLGGRRLISADTLNRIVAGERVDDDEPQPA